MNLSAVMTEIGSVLDALTGLRVTPHPVKTIVAPAGVVGYPESITFDVETGRGADRFERLPVMVVVADVTARSTAAEVSKWISGAGALSVKAAFEAHDWASCDDVWLREARFDTVTIAAVDYLAVIMMVDVVGSGEA